jgi:exosortase D (VPLPA-CTERM-specific)
MNSLRIAIIGVLVEYWGIAMAEGFLHDFEGWAVFLVCVIVLFFEVWILVRLTGRSGQLAGFFRFDLPRWRTPKLATRGLRPIPTAYLAALTLLVVAAAGSTFLSERQERIPDRKSFVLFPDRIGDWSGRKEGMEQRYLRVLQLDDYILANYRQSDHKFPVNFYVAYYNSQRKGQSAHSPSSCLPGDGWKIDQFAPQTVSIGDATGSLTVNRAVISKGNSAQLVYYWFPQRGRQLTNEYLVKWFLFWDALTRNRTDGALVRLVTSVEGHDFKSADARLTDFLMTVHPHLQDYVPK